MCAFRKLFLAIAILMTDYVKDAQCYCTLNLDKDFGTPSPVYLQNGGYLEPMLHGTGAMVKLQKNDVITVACPGEHQNVVLGNTTTNVNDVDAKCVEGNHFRVLLGKGTADWQHWRGQFKEITCKRQPYFSSEYVGECSSGGNKLYRVGYGIRNKLYALYEACFDPSALRTIYVKHTISPYNKFNQIGVKRPSFVEGGLFSNVQMSKLYGISNQRAQFDSALGTGANEKYLTKKRYLSRGHLAPKADYTFHAQQRATFHYVNTAPQWMQINGGDWAALEEALRRRVNQLNKSVTVYTGVLGDMTLPDARGLDRSVGLALDRNNNPLVLVPLYFFKAVYSPKDKKATIFVTINSSVYNKSTNEALTLCADQCAESDETNAGARQRFAWLRWRADGAKSFCCDYDSFASVTRSKLIPHLDDSGGLFY